MTVGDVIAAINAAGLNVTAGLNAALTTQTLVDDLNGGQGVAAGSLQITDRSGASASVAIAPGMTVGGVIAAINAAGLNVTAGLNAAGFATRAFRG